jgi:integrase
MLQWVDPETGHRKSRSAKTDLLDDAEKARADLEYELNHGTYQERSRLDWERFREMFEAEYLPGLRPRSQEKYITVLDVFAAIIKPARLGAITERTVSAFVKGLRERKRGNTVGLVPMTIKNYCVALRSCLLWAVQQRLIARAPNFPTIKVPKKKPQPVPAEAFEKLIAKAPDEQWKTYLLCGWWAGLRLSEALHLQWESSDRLPWVDLEGQRIVLPAVFAKSGQDQWVPLHPVLRQALVALPRRDNSDAVFDLRTKVTNVRLTRSGISTGVLQLAKKAGVRLSMHRLRKGFGCRVALSVGKSGAAVLHELMRHSSMQTTMDYYVNVDGAKTEAMQRLT